MTAGASGERTFTVRVDFLTRPCLTLTGADAAHLGRRIEWPPHPHRLFAALTAAHYETEVGRRETLEWLERQAPPSITAGEISERTLGAVYVPVNDRITRASVASQREKPLGDRRGRQERTFAIGSPVPRASADENDSAPDHRSVYYTWRTDEVPPEDLDDILFEVTRLGHSSSVVAASLWTGEPPNPTWVPDQEGDLQIRVPRAGTLDVLDQAHQIRTRGTRVQDRLSLALPPAHTETYRRSGEPPPPSGPWRESWTWTLEPRVSVTAWIHLADCIRGALLAALPDGTASKILTGHAQGHHLAMMPMPSVGHRHASGDILGFSILVPELSPADRDQLLMAMGKLEEIRAGALGMFRAEHVKLDPRRALDMASWTGPSCYWATVTPIVFDRFPKRGVTPEEVVADGVEHLGLPRPVEVVTGWDGALPGIPRSPEFRVHRKRLPPGRRSDQRPWSHAFLRFDQPVKGPILVGAKRHFGLGLCKPFYPKPAEDERAASNSSQRSGQGRRR